jgi:hypothetical protein
VAPWPGDRLVFLCQRPCPLHRPWRWRLRSVQLTDSMRVPLPPDGGAPTRGQRHTRRQTAEVVGSGEIEGASNRRGRKPARSATTATGSGSGSLRRIHGRQARTHQHLQPECLARPRAQETGRRGGGGPGAAGRAATRAWAAAAPASTSPTSGLDRRLGSRHSVVVAMAPPLPPSLPCSSPTAWPWRIPCSPRPLGWLEKAAGSEVGPGRRLP